MEKINMPVISTLIFMDLETTGLPSYIGKKNVHITELSLLAVDRNDFENDESFRIINKLSFCIRPRVAISPGAMDITRLYNDALQNQEEFNETISKTLTYFLKRLRPPVCLLAHNGNKFDFPVLQAELNRINCSLEAEILCADTLEAFRSIGINPKDNMQGQICNNENFSNIQPDSNAKNENFMSNDEVEALLSEDLDLFQNIEEIQVKNNDHLGKSSNSTFLFQYNNANSKTKDLSSVLTEDLSSVFTRYKTPVHSPSISKIKNFKMRVQKSKKISSDTLYSPKNEYKQTSFHFIPAKRRLFCEENDANSSKMTVSSLSGTKNKVQFSLQKLYHHFFGENPPESHYAEADCIALSKVCQKIQKEFLKWIDVNSNPFCETKAMW